MNPLSILLYIHGVTFAASIQISETDCKERADQLNEDGIPALCVSKSCVDLVVESKPGWMVECYARGKEPPLVPDKKKPGVM